MAPLHSPYRLHWERELGLCGYSRTREYTGTQSVPVGTGRVSTNFTGMDRVRVRAGIGLPALLAKICYFFAMLSMYYDQIKSRQIKFIKAERPDGH